MDDEGNIQVVHKKCGPKPLGITQATDDLIGKLVKLPFTGEAPDGSSVVEHMWVLVRSRFNQQLNGELRSEPILKFPEAFKLGAMVVFTAGEIEAIEDGGS